MNEIKPIETIYNGYRFRSRLEARYAVLFDECGIKYMYESEGFELSDKTFYLPDFYLPASKTYFEVKGIMTESDYHKVVQLQNDLKCSVAIGYGDFTFQASDQWEEDCFELTSKDSSWFVKCYECGQFFFVGNAGSYRCPCCGHYDGDNTFAIISEGDSGGKLYFTRRGRNPFDFAKQARFERGGH